MTQKEHEQNPLLAINIELLPNEKILQLDSALVREKLATYPVVSAAKEYTLSFAITYSGFTQLKQENEHFADIFDIFIAKLEDLIQTVCIEHATTNNAIQEHTEGMTREKLTEFNSWLESTKIQPEILQQLTQIIIELIRLTNIYISKFNATDGKLPPAISEEKFSPERENDLEIAVYYEEIEDFLVNIEYAITPQELIDLYCEHYETTPDEVLDILAGIATSDTGLDFESLLDLFGPILFE